MTSGAVITFTSNEIRKGWIFEDDSAFYFEHDSGRLSLCEDLRLLLPSKELGCVLGRTPRRVVCPPAFHRHCRKRNQIAFPTVPLVFPWCAPVATTALP